MGTIEKLREAHIAFELDYVMSSPAAFLQQELDFVFDLIDTTALEDIISRDWLAAQFLELPFSHVQKEITKNLILPALGIIKDALQRSNITIDEVMSKDQFDRIVGNMTKMKENRQDLIHQICISNFYARFVSDILYRGIKNFLLEENVLAKNFPGASTLISMGRNLMNKVPGMDENSVDEKLVEFVQKNIKKSLHDSEQFLNATLDGKLSSDLANELWELCTAMPPGRTVGILKETDLNDLAQSIAEVVLDFSHKEKGRALYSDIGLKIFDQHRASTFSDLLLKAGLDRKYFIELLSHQIEPFLETPPIKNFIVHRIENRLNQFYDSDVCKAVLEG